MKNKLISQLLIALRNILVFSRIVNYKFSQLNGFVITLADRIFVSKFVLENVGRRVYSHPVEAGGIVLNTWVGESECLAPSIYKLSETYSYKQFYGPVYYCIFNKAEISTETDIVRLEHCCYWYKLRHPAFGNMVPLDKDLRVFNGHDSIVISETQPKQIRIKSAFSLLGVHDSHWAHFLVQYFPKLRYLRQALEAFPDVVVLAPDALDGQSKELLTDFMAENGLRDRIVYIDTKTSVLCEELHWVDHTSWLFDHSESASTLSVVVPKDVVAFLNAAFSKIENRQSDSELHERIYLRRNGTRTTENIDEIDNILLSLGFKIVDPAVLSLTEKKAIFSQASVIVGQISSAFTNILMCQPGTKVVSLTNADRLLDHYLPAMAFASRIKFITLSGEDCKPIGPHSNYKINTEQLALLMDEIL